MSKSKELVTTTNLVKAVLQKHIPARNSDDYLYIQVCELVAREKGTSLQSMNVTNFFLHRSERGFPPFESVRRARQKVQATCPELRGDADVEAMRTLNQEVYEEYARAVV